MIAVKRVSILSALPVMAGLFSVAAFAATAPPKDRALIRQFEDAYEKCQYVLEHGDACEVAGKLGKKLDPRKYCVYGHGVVGKASRDGKHCYTIR